MAQSTERQFDALLGISKRMEQSLESIEKSLAPAGSGMGSGASSAAGNLASMALSLNTIVKALSAKEFKKKNADTLLSFVEGMAAATQDLKAENLKALAEFSTGITSFMKVMSEISLGGIMKIALLEKFIFSGKKSVLKRIIAGAMDAMSSYTKQDMEKMKVAAEGIAILSQGLMTLAKALAAWALLALAAPLVIAGALVARVVVGMFLNIGKNNKQIKEGAEAVGILGRSLIMLALGIASMALLVAIVKPQQILRVILVVGAVIVLFALIGKMENLLLNGAYAVKKIGIALIFFSIGLAMISLVVMIVPTKAIFLGLLVVASYGLVFAMMGMASKQISRGALVMIIGMSVGLFFFAGALLLFGMALEKITFEKALLGVAIIFGMGALFTYLGTNAPLIEEGAFVMASMGVSLIFFSAGMLIFALALKGVIALFKNDWEVAAAATVGIILGLGLMFAGLGLLSPAIAPGAIVLALMGASLAVFAIGLIAFSLVLKGVMALFKNDWEEAKVATTEIILGMGKLFTVMGLMSPLIALGSIAVLTVGAALLVFSVGLMTFALATKLVKSLGLLQEKGDTYEFMGTSIIKSIVNGVISVGGPIKMVRALMGAATMVAVGGALLVFSLGLAATAKVIDKIPNNFTETLFGESDGIIPEILGRFKQIGKDYGSFLSFGSDPVSMGVKVVKGVSSALSSLAGGIAAFAKVDKFPVQIADEKTGKLKWGTVDLNTSITNIESALIGEPGFLLAIARVFGKIGNDPMVTGVSGERKYGGAFFTSLIKTFTGQTPFQRGVRAVAEMGSVLQSLAGGIVAFANVDRFPVQVPDDKGNLKWDTVNLNTIIANIENVMNGDPGILMTIARTFGKIGNDPAVTGVEDGKGEKGLGGFFSGLWRNVTGDSPMKRGIKAVGQISEILGTLAGGITAFANANAIPVQTVINGELKWTTVDLATIKKNIEDVLIGKEGPDKIGDGLLYSLAKVFAKIGERGEDSLMNDKFVKRGAKAVQSVSDALGGISQTILAFAEMEKRIPVKFDKDGKPIDWQKINQAELRASIESFISMIPDTFSKLSADTISKAQKNAKEYKTLTEALSQLASPVKILSEAFAPKGDKKDQKGPLTTLTEELNNFLNFLATNPVTDAVVATLLKLHTALNMFSVSESPFAKFVDSFKDFNSSFGSFTGNIGKFAENFKKLSPMVSNYQKFAALLNGHAVYATRFAIWQPAFGRMSSKDLAEFAKNFKSMDAKAIDAFRIWTEALTNFVKVDPNTFETIADQLEKVINAPVNVEGRLANAGNNTGNTTGGFGSIFGGQTPAPGADTLKNSEQSNAIFERVTSRYNNDIAQIRADIAAMTQQIQILSSRLVSSEGINVRVIGRS